MKIYEKYQSILILISVVLGVMLGKIENLAQYVDQLIVVFLMIMLYGVFLQIPLEHLKDSFKNTRFTLTSLMMNFILTPVVAGLLGFLFLKHSPSLWVGFVMLMVTPCTDWYLVFTSMAKGNVSLSLAILPLNLILQLVLLPVYLFLFTGQQGSLDVTMILQSIVIVLIIPLILANITKLIVRRIKRRESVEKHIFSKLGVIQFIFLNLAILSMFASQGETLIENPQLLVIMLLPIVLFFVFTFLIGQLIGKLGRFSYSDTVSLNLTTMARNSPISLAIALTAFPDQPLIALVLVIGPLIELPLLAITSQLLLLIKK